MLVIDDMLGMFERTPRFVKRYDDLARPDRRSSAHLCRKRFDRAPLPDRRPDLPARKLACSAPFAFGAAAARRGRRQLPFITGGEGKRPASGSPIERTEARLAQPPDISETFVREVDENLRRDQLRDFFKAYGSWLIAARRSCSSPRAAA